MQKIITIKEHIELCQKIKKENKKAKQKINENTKCQSKG